LDPPPGPASSGDLTIRFGTRTSDVALEVFYDIREGSLDGPILHSDSDTIQTTAPVPWSATPPEGALEIPGHSEGFYFAAGGQGFGVHLEGTNMEWTAVGEESVVVPTLSAWAVAVLGLELGALGVLMIRRSRRQDAR
jgi:hypothetical protein